MCENGKVYQACAEPCKKTCSNFASNPEPCCKHADPVEGCYCPKDFAENGKLTQYLFTDNIDHLLWELI